MAKKSKPPKPPVTPKMKRAGAEVLASATDMPATELVALIYQEMDKARSK